MAKITKEKNIIIFELETNKSYKLDINTGVWTGIRGKELLNMPTGDNKTALKNMCNNNTSSLLILIYKIFYWNEQTRTVHNCNRLRLADKLDSIKFPPSDLRTYNENLIRWADNNIKYIAVYIKEHSDENIYLGDIYKTYKHEQVLSKFKDLAPLVTESMTNSMFYHQGNYPITDELIDLIGYYWIRGKLFDFGATDEFYAYLRLCRLLNKEPQKVNNFMREYIETKKEYEQRKQELDEQAFTLAYKIREKHLTFEYGNYQIVLPTKSTDLIDEGRKMSHCVGGYIQNVVQNTCYIVFVRNKATPDKCYITCQVMPDGNINQYYLAHDRRISTAEDIEFKEKYQEHLLSVWNS